MTTTEEAQPTPCELCGTPVTDEDAWTATFYDDTVKRICGTCAEQLQTLAPAAREPQEDDPVCPHCSEPANPDDLDEPVNLSSCSKCGGWVEDIWSQDTMECPACDETLFLCEHCKEWAVEEETILKAVMCPNCGEPSEAAAWGLA